MVLTSVALDRLALRARQQLGLRETVLLFVVAERRRETFLFRRLRRAARSRRRGEGDPD